MERRTTWKRLSQRARAALADELDEVVLGIDSLDELEAAALASMANRGGGIVLAGVAEVGDQGDAAGGYDILGCEVDATARDHILDLARSCAPPIPVEILVENTAHTPFLRVEVPSAGESGAASRVLVPAHVAAELLDGLEELTAELTALRGEVEGLRARVAELHAASRQTQSRLDEVQRTARDSVGRVRALARHLGADDKLVAWERRQLRNLLSAAVDMAGKRARGGEQDDVVRQMRKTWSRFTEWVSDEVVDPLQRDDGPIDDEE